jgi:hypothetical protein
MLKSGPTTDFMNLSQVLAASEGSQRESCGLSVESETPMVAGIDEADALRNGSDQGFQWS